MEQGVERQMELEFGVPVLQQLGMYFLFGNLELEHVLNAAGSHPMDDFPWYLEIQIRFQKGARMFPRLEEMRFSEIHQTIRSVNLH